MLNSIATAIIAYLHRSPAGSASSTRRTTWSRPSRCPASVWFFAIDMGPAGELWGFIFVAVARRRRVLVRRSAAPASASTCAPSGQSESAAAASGVDVKKMVAHQHAHLGRGGRSGRHADPARRHPPVQQRLPAGHRLHRHRHRAARPQQPDRHRASAPCCGASWSATTNHLEFTVTTRRSSASSRASSSCASSIAYELVRRYGLKRQQQRRRRRARGPGRRTTETGGDGMSRHDRHDHDRHRLRAAGQAGQRPAQVLPARRSC